MTTIDALITIILLLGLIILTHILQKRIPVLPIPLIQIAVGVILGVLFGVSMQLDYKLIMLLFIAPKLFASGKSLTKEEMNQHKAPIFVLSVVLVIVTVFGGGALLRYLIPDMPYAVCLTLAAVLSPTDSSVIVEVAKRIKLPVDLKTIFKGESLVNDATGIVLFNFAVSAVLADDFSFGTAIAHFILVLLGGIAIGVPVTIVIMYLVEKLKDIGIEDATVFTLIQILTPFLLYYVASLLHLSGAAAVVTGGIIYSLWPKKKHSLKDFNIGLVADGAWSTLIFVLSGLIYLFLGINLPLSIQNALLISYVSVPLLVWYSVAVFVVLAAARFIFSLVVFGKHTAGGRRLYNATLSLFSGPRGLVTLAACLSIPQFLPDETPFPYRYLVLFISSAIIIPTLLQSTFILPLIAQKKNKDDLGTVHNANRRLIGTVIDRLRAEITEENRTAMYTVISHYQELLDERYSKAKTPRREVTRADVLLYGVAVEIEEAERLRLVGGFDDAALRLVLYRLSVVQMRFSGKIPLLHEFKHYITALKKHETHIDHDEIAKIKLITISAAMRAIEAYINTENRAMCMSALFHYGTILENYTKTAHSEEGHEFVEMKRGLDYKSIQLQKNILQKMLEDHEISQSTYSTLRRVIRLREIAFLTSVDRTVSHN